MRRVMVGVIVLATVGAAASAIRAGGGGSVWVAVVCVGVGTALGIAYARSRRGWADYRYTTRQVPILRRSFVNHAGRLLFLALLVLGAIAMAMGARGR